MAGKIPPGTKVTCRPDRDRWAVRVFPSLDGQTGTVEKYKDGVPGFDRDRYLVTFAEPVAGSSGWWLDTTELEVCP